MMDFGALQDRMSEVRESKQIFGVEITETRISLARDLLALLRGEKGLLRELLCPGSLLAAYDNCTKATWVARSFAFCLTQYYVPSTSFFTLTFRGKKGVIRLWHGAAGFFYLNTNPIYRISVRKAF